jgi:hypothetical protein
MISSVWQFSFSLYVENCIWKSRSLSDDNIPPKMWQTLTTYFNFSKLPLVLTSRVVLGFRLCWDFHVFWSGDFPLRREGVQLLLVTLPPLGSGTAGSHSFSHHQTHTPSVLSHLCRQTVFFRAFLQFLHKCDTLQTSHYNSYSKTQLLSIHDNVPISRQWFYVSFQDFFLWKPGKESTIM